MYLCVFFGNKTTKNNFAVGLVAHVSLRFKSKVCFLFHQQSKKNKIKNDKCLQKRVPPTWEFFQLNPVFSEGVPYGHRVPSNLSDVQIISSSDDAL